MAESYNGVKFRGEFNAAPRANRSYAVEITDYTYFDEPKPLKFAGDYVTITYGERDGSELQPIKASECELSILCDDDSSPYAELYTLDPSEHRLFVYESVDGGEYKCIWRGYIATGEYAQSLKNAPYHLTVRANDGFAILKSIP